MLRVGRADAVLGQPRFMGASTGAYGQDLVCCQQLGDPVVGDREEPFDELVSEKHINLRAGGLGFNKPSGSRKGVSSSSKRMGEHMKREERRHC